jgi:hypothetical protein
MKKLTDKTKRIMVIAGLSVASVILVIAISYQFKSAPAKETKVISSSSSGAVTVGAIDTDNGKAESTASASSSSTNSSSSKTNQVIQPDVSKPAAPSSKPDAQGSTSNPSKAPTYSSKDTSPSKASEPKDGDKKDGKIYITGFGWITDQGGGGSGTTVDGSGDINKPVGQMD